MITAGQIRAARALIGWKQTDLAKASGVAEISIKNIEREATDPRSSTLAALQAAFEKAGVVFLEPGDTRDGGPGLRLKKPEHRRALNNEFPASAGKGRPPPVRQHRRGP
jgi:transcriptional regulator with XRE-family HTH domain